MTDVPFTDGDVVFEDEDVLWDKLGTSLTIQNAKQDGDSFTVDFGASVLTIA